MAAKKGSKKTLTLFHFGVTKNSERSCEVHSENDLSLTTYQVSSVTGAETTIRTLQPLGKRRSGAET